MSQFRSARRRISVSVGESVRIIRERQEFCQNQLAMLFFGLVGHKKP
jgi:hypothetical protein